MKDTQSLVGAKTGSHEIKTYDDSYGPLWIARNSIGIYGIVRARTWEDAYSICEDEFFDEATDTVEEMKKEYGFRREHVKMIIPKDAGPIRAATLSDYPLSEHQFVRWDTIETPSEDFMENDIWQEAFGFRPSGPNASDVLKHGIYAKDLSGDYLEKLTPGLIEELQITLTIEDNE